MFKHLKILKVAKKLSYLLVRHIAWDFCEQQQVAFHL